MTAAGGSNGLRLGVHLGYAEPGTPASSLVELAREAERLGFDSVWSAEAWGTDCVTVLTWVAAVTTTIKLGTGVMQIPARAPAAAAMTAATLDQLSGGRMLLGLGSSGPQVVEGWYGQPWRSPVGRTREYVTIVRQALRRETVEHHGSHYDIPYAGPTSAGLGKPLRLMLHPQREIPVYLASVAPKAVALTAEVADGWMPIFFDPEHAREVFGPVVDRPGLDVAPVVNVALDDDVAAAVDSLRPYYALYIGGMGARGKNFYTELAGRFGYEREAARIQDLYLAGKHDEAAAAVPRAFVERVALVGPKEGFAERLAAFREAGATTLICSTRDVAALRALAEVAL